MNYTQTQIKAACKENNIDPAPILASLKKGRESAKERPFWQSFLKVWHDFNLHERKQTYLITKKDIPNLAEIYDLIKKRCDMACYEWNEDCACRSFSLVLKRALSHSEFIKRDFRPLHIANQFNSIVSNVKGTTKTVNADYKSKLLAGTQTN